MYLKDESGEILVGLCCVPQVWRLKRRRMGARASTPLRNGKWQSHGKSVWQALSHSRTLGAVGAWRTEWIPPGCAGGRWKDIEAEGIKASKRWRGTEQELER